MPCTYDCPRRRVFAWMFIIGVVGTLVGLGFWQLQRLEWKEKLMAEYEAGLAQPPLDIAEVKSADLPNLDYRRVTFQGTFQNDKELHLGGRRWYGKTGYEVLTPMKLQDGRIFLVNRGWIPFEMKEQEKRPDAAPMGRQSLQGIIRLPQQAALFTPANHPEKNFWFTADIPAMSTQISTSLAPVILEVTAETPDINHFPIPSDGKRVFRNDHLGYAITWFLLAIAAGIMFWARLLRKPAATKS